MTQPNEQLIARISKIRRNSEVGMIVTVTENTVHDLLGDIRFLLNVLDRVKAERDEQTKRGDQWMWDFQSCCKERESLRNELSAKDKVLEEIAEYGGTDMIGKTCANKARSILSQYEVKE